MKTVTGKKFRLPGLGRVPRGFPGNGLGAFHSISCILGAPTRHQYRHGYDASPTRMASPFASGLARPHALAAVACRQRATRRSRVGTLPRPMPLRGFCPKVPFRFPPRPGIIHPLVGVSWRPNVSMQDVCEVLSLCKRVGLGDLLPIQLSDGPAQEPDLEPVN